MTTRSTTPRSTAAALVLPTLVLLAGVLVLAGCSDDDDSPTPAASSAPPGEQVSACRARIDVTGDVESRWRSRAEVSLRNADDEGAGPEARYTSDDGASALTLYSAGPEFEPTVTLRLDGRTWSSGQGPRGLEAAEDGTGATADVRLTGPEDATARLEADFACSDAQTEG